MSAEFFQGRHEADLVAHLKQVPIPDIKDTIFGATRLDQYPELKVLHSGNFKHCTLANVSLLDVRLDSFNFVDCVFLSCYFRRSDLRNCTFMGCRFIDCSFPKKDLKMKGCDFDHSTFVRCFVPLQPGRYNLPGKEHNLRALIATNWATEAEQAGETREARTYRQIAAHASERVLWKTALADGEHYQRHTSVARRTNALYEYVRSRINYRLWGYGDQAWRAGIWYILLALGMFPLIFLLSRDGLNKANGTEPGWLDVTFLSLSNILNNNALSAITVDSTWTRTVAALESLTGLVFVGILITLLFRWIVRR
jgi:hypothetical protein